jgi:hypothetical protein
METPVTFNEDLETGDLVAYFRGKELGRLSQVEKMEFGRYEGIANLAIRGWQNKMLNKARAIEMGEDDG